MPPLASMFRRVAVLGSIAVLLAGMAAAIDPGRRDRFADLAADVLGLSARADDDAGRWRLAAVELGPIRSAVLATGTLQPTRVVQVSSQISGQVVEVLGDFNGKVAVGQIVARLDPTTLQGRLDAARADLAVAEATIATRVAAVEKAKAELTRIEEARRDAARSLERLKQLAKTGTTTERSVEQAEVALRQADAQIRSSKADIAMAEAERATAEATVLQKKAAFAITETDLERTNIRAPIDGIIIDRTVEVGQTVAASLSAPILFQIAADLGSMQLEASIDEADVGRIRDGARALFTVDAYPGRIFEGQVTQVRRAAKTVQNVVTYTAVASADNSSLALFPGMTATVRVIVAEKREALKVPAAALRFRPEEPPSGPDRRRAREMRPPEEGGRARLHVLGADGAPRPVDVTLGIATEAEVEIQPGPLSPGDKVILGRVETPGAGKPASPMGF